MRTGAALVAAIAGGVVVYLAVAVAFSHWAHGRYRERGDHE